MTATVTGVRLFSGYNYPGFNEGYVDKQDLVEPVDDAGSGYAPAS